MKTDGYIFTPELLQWRYFHRPVVVQVLIHVLLSSAHNEASAATLSYRDLALQLHTTVKTIRVAIDVLIAEKIITKCAAPRASTKLYVNSSHPLSHCIIPWQRDQGAQVTAHFGAQIGAHTRAQISHSETPLNKGDSEDLEVSMGTDKGTIKGTKRAQHRAQPKQGAQPKAQSKAQISHSEPPLNKGVSEDLETTKGTDKGKAKGTEVRGKKQIKEKLSPETPIKENKQRKQKPLPLSPEKEKKKKSKDAEDKMQEVLRLFNLIFLGTSVKTISKLTPERKRMVAKFISDYSFEDVEPMFCKAHNSDLLMGREDGRCSVSFNWLFNPKNYEPLMEGTYDNPTVVASTGKKKHQASISQPTAISQPQREETNEEIEARLRQKEERKKALEEKQTEALRQKYLVWIEHAKKDPNGSMAKMVKKAYERGTLAELGIVWNPSVAEEEQSLADLDDQTTTYLKSLLSD